MNLLILKNNLEFKKRIQLNVNKSKYSIILL